MNIISIRHSGTHSLAKMIYPKSQYMANNCFTHTKTKHLNKIYRLIAKGELLLAPYRHPCRIWQSWKGEQKARLGCDYTMDNFIDEHDNLISLYNTGRVSIVALDHETAGARLSYISMKTGRTLDTDIKPQNTQFNTVNIEITDSMRNEIPDKYLYFYRTLTRT